MKFLRLTVVAVCVMAACADLALAQANSFPPSSLSPSPSPSPASSPLLFWKTRADLYKKMKEDRYVVVSAHAEDQGKDKVLTIVTAGIIHAPVSFSHKEIMTFKDYPSYLPYIQETSYDSVTHNLFVHGSLLGYHVRMTLHIDEHTTENGDEIAWESISGGFVGMKGIIREEAADADHTETSMDATYLSKEIPLPGIILKWGLEFAGQRVTEAMRKHIESDWQSAKKY